jgi:hypothetical protein
MGCKAASAPMVIAPLQNQQGLVIVFPNPFSGVVMVQAVSADVTISYLRVFALDGKLMETKKVNDFSLFSWPSQNLPAGTYLLEFTTNKGRQVLKVVKQY